jgi:sugar lactone lactonase YvrE
MLPLTSALAHPGSAIVVDRLGQVWFLDTGDGLWKIDRSGRLIRMGGDRFHWMTIDPDNLFARTTLPSRDIGRVGTNPTLLIASDFPIAFGVDGNLYFPSHARDGRVQIMRTLPTGATSVLATLPATVTNAEPLQHLNGLTGGEDGALYFTENKAIRRITMQGRVSTVAADVHAPSCAAIPGNPASDRPFLRGLAVDARGVMYVAASGCGSVLKITPDGRVSTLVQTQSPWSPTAVALFGADVYVLEYFHTEIEDRRAWIPRVRKISSDGKSVVVATVARR